MFSPIDYPKKFFAQFLFFWKTEILKNWKEFFLKTFKFFNRSVRFILESVWIRILHFGKYKVLNVFTKTLNLMCFVMSIHLMACTKSYWGLFFDFCTKRNDQPRSILCELHSATKQRFKLCLLRKNSPPCETKKFPEQKDATSTLEVSGQKITRQNTRGLKIVIQNIVVNIHQ